jgi:hypothetical protein
VAFLILLEIGKMTNREARMTKKVPNPNLAKAAGVLQQRCAGRAPCRRSFIRHWLLVIGLGIVTGFAGKAATQSTSTENNIKAVYLFHFAQFVEWPTNAFTNAQAPMIIGVLGRDNLSSSIEEAVAGESAHGRRLIVKRCASVEDAQNCHILFISRSEGDRMDKILPRLEGKSILTVSDTDTFTARGGMIRFITERNHIRFRINNQAAEKSGLTISSKVLRLAEGSRLGVLLPSRRRGEG